MPPTFVSELLANDEKIEGTLQNPDAVPAVAHLQPHQREAVRAALGRQGRFIIGDDPEFVRRSCVERGAKHQV